MFDWNDLRYFLATARGGSTVAAAEILRVNQSTVGRRIAALEASLGTILFDRTVTGYQLTEVGRELLPAAERTELEAGAMLLMVEQRARRVAGTIKVTTNETIADLFLMPSLPELAGLYPDIRVDVIVSARQLNLERGEADVALRAARRPNTEGVARELSKLPWAIYCSRGYAKAHGQPASPKELCQHRIIGVDGSLAAVAGFDWLETNAGHDAVVARTNSLPNLHAAVRAELGISALPCVRGEADSELVRCIGPNDELGSFVWLVTRRDVTREPRTRAFSSFIAMKTPVLRELLRFDHESGLASNAETISGARSSARVGTSSLPPA